MNPLTLEPLNLETLRSLRPSTRNTHATPTLQLQGEEGGGEGGAERVILVSWESPDGSARAAGIQVLGVGKQRIIGHSSVDVVGSGRSEGKRMSMRVTREVGHPCRLWEF